MAGDGRKKGRKLENGEVEVHITPTPMAYLKLRSRTLVITPSTKRRRMRKTDSAPAVVISGRCSGVEDGDRTGILSRRWSRNSSVEVDKFRVEAAGVGLEEVEEEQWSRSSDRVKEGEETKEGFESTSCNLLIHGEEERIRRTREPSPSSHGDLGDMEPSKGSPSRRSPTVRASTKRSPRRGSPTGWRAPRITNLSARMPAEEEIESFFAVMERDQKKMFMEKYNYDVVNDLPMEGRYEWVELKP